MHLAKDQHHNDRLVATFLPLTYGTSRPSIDDLIKDGLICGSNLAEVAISKKSGIDLCPEGVYRDLVDDTDIKTITVQKKYFRKTVNKKKTKEKIPRYQAVIKDAYKKIGLLRVVCFNPVTNKYYHFMIPPSAYCKVRNITISFNKETQEPQGNWANYLVPDFDAICRPLTLKERIDQLVSNVGKDNLADVIDQIMELTKQENE